MYRQLERHYRNQPRVTWKVENGKLNWLEVQDHDLRFCHGHIFKGGTGILGAFGPIRRKIAQLDLTRKAHQTLFGHLHTHLKDEHWCMNNSVIGYGGYSLEIGAKCRPPSQTLLVFDKKREPPVLVQEIFCD